MEASALEFSCSESHQEGDAGSPNCLELKQQLPQILVAIPTCACHFILIIDLEGGTQFVEHDLSTPDKI
jgi:hypothetical protein